DEKNKPKDGEHYFCESIWGNNKVKMFTEGKTLCSDCKRVIAQSENSNIPNVPYFEQPEQTFTVEDMRKAITIGFSIGIAKRVAESADEIISSLVPKIVGANYDGMHCKGCNKQGLYNCAHPEECGGPEPITYTKGGKTFVKLKIEYEK
ncbi:MAG: hypothetical protein V4651_01180, partial [Bacteroidota bacterium]